MKRIGFLLAATLSCGGGSATTPFREPSIAFDRGTYNVTLTSDAGHVLTRDEATVVVTPGRRDPADACGQVVGLARCARRRVYARTYVWNSGCVRLRPQTPGAVRGSSSGAKSVKSVKSVV